MSEQLKGKIAAVTGSASGIGFASAKAMLDEGATVIFIDRNESALSDICSRLGDKALPLVIDLLDPEQCKEMVPRILEMTGHLDIFHANAGLYVGGDLMESDADQIDRMLNLNINVVMKNVQAVLAHMIERETGDILVTSSLAAHYPTPWEPIYASSKWAIDCFVQTTRRQMFKHGIRIGSVSPGPVATGLLSDWPEDKLKEARANGSLIETEEIAEALLFMLTRPRHMTVRDMVIIPTNFDL